MSGDRTWKDGQVVIVLSVQLLLAMFDAAWRQRGPCVSHVVVATSRVATCHTCTGTTLLV